MATDPSHDPPGEPPGEHEDRESAEEAAWRAIVENYGDRAQLEDPEPTTPPAAQVPPSAKPTAEEDEHFVPPPPPPLPKAPPERLLAWIGLFGVPLVVLVAVVLGLAFPSWLSVLLLAWFVGGFVFLVATMRPRPDDPDDGAVV